jgi:hypothetical protein
MSLASLIESKLESVKEQYSDLLLDKPEDYKDGISFMFYSLSTIFPEFSSDDIEDSIIDSSFRDAKYDFGIDSVILSCNKSYINSVEELNDYNDDSFVDIYFLQFKKGTSSDQASFLKFKDGVEKCFIRKDYVIEDNEYLFHKFNFINKAKDSIYQKFKVENIKINLLYIFSGLKENVFDTPILKSAIDSTTRLLSENCYNNCNFSIVGAQELINLEKNGREIVDIVKYEKSLKYITENAKRKKLTGYISVLRAEEIAILVKKYQTSLFEANIRDFFKKNDINSNILKTCSDDIEANYFWSYNNGLTITCSKVDELPNDKYRLHGIQIVNGCQTSNALYLAIKNLERYNELKEKNEDELIDKEREELQKVSSLKLNLNTSILARIIETDDKELIYRITETTNSQTPIKSFSLKANDDIQKNIQEYLLQKGVYYERRLNFYRNQGKRNPISIQKLFQLYVAHVLIQPSKVKTRPSSMLQEMYDSVFPSPLVKSIDYSLYLIPIKVDLAIKKYIKLIQKSNIDSDLYNQQLYTHGQFHLGCLFLHSVLQNKYNQKGIIKNHERILQIINNDDDSEFITHFHIATSNLKKIVQNYAGQKKEIVPFIMKKSDIDEKIMKFVNSITE